MVKPALRRCGVPRSIDPDAVEAELAARGPWLCGERLTLADVSPGKPLR